MNDDNILSVLDFVRPQWSISNRICKNYKMKYKTHFMIAFKERCKSIWINYPKSNIDPFVLCQHGEFEMFIIISLNLNESEHDSYFNLEECFEGACYGGNVNLVKFIYEKCIIECKPVGLLYGIYNEPLYQACISGNIDTVKYVLSISKDNLFEKCIWSITKEPKEGVDYGEMLKFLKDQEYYESETEEETIK